MAELTNDQQGLLKTVNNSFSGRLSEIFSNLAQKRVEISITKTLFVEYNVFLESLLHSTVIGIFNTALSSDQMLVEVSPKVGYYFMDKIAGGKGGTIDLEKKKLTDLEKVIFEKFVFLKIMTSWEEVWKNSISSPLGLSFVRIESDPYLTRRMEGKFVQLVMNCNYEHGNETMNICIPMSVAENISKITSKEEISGKI